MVTLGSLGTQSYFLNWLLAVAAPSSSYLPSPDSSATELSELWAILSHILAKVEKWRGHDCCYRRQFWVERVEKWCGKRSSRRMHHRCDRWTASWPTSTNVISALSSLPSWSCSPALCSADMTAAGGRMWDMSRVCSPRTVSGVARARTLHNNAVYNNTTAGPREPHHTLALAAPPQQWNTGSPQPLSAVSVSLCWCWWSPRTPAFEPTPAAAAAHLSRAAVLTAY